MRFCFCIADVADLDAADADAQIQPLSPRFSTDAEVQMWLDGPTDFMISDIDVSDMTTRRKVLRRILGDISINQVVAGENRYVVPAVFSNPLDSKLTKAERDDVAAKIGVTVAANKTVREVMRDIRAVRKWPMLSFVKVVI